MFKYGFVLGLSALFSLTLTPAVERLAIWIGAVDTPGGRRIHLTPTPRFGGLAVLSALVLGLVAAAFLDSFVALTLSRQSSRLALLMGGAVILTLVGLIDDRCSVRPAIKLVAEVTAAIFAVVAGYRIAGVMNISLGWFGPTATILWIVAIVNAVNMVDGLDGLATGLGLTISGTLFALSLYAGGLDTVLILAALCGALLGFLPYNFHPARIFLGDSGSLLIGFLLAATAADRANKAATVAAILAPLLALGLPAAELAVTTLRRFLRTVEVNRRGAEIQRYKFLFVSRPAPFTADRDHIHHRLMSLGIDHRSAVFVLYTLNAALCALSFVLVSQRQVNQALLLGAFAIVAFAGLRRLGYTELCPLKRGLLLPLFDLSIMSRKLTYVMFDLAFIIMSCVAAYLIRGEGSLTLAARRSFLDEMPLLALVQIGAFLLSGLYRRSYRYAGIPELMATLKALAFAIIASWLIVFAAAGSQRPHLSLPVLDAYVLASLIIGSRMSFRLLDYLFRSSRPRARRVLIYGAGNTGTAAIEAIQIHPDLNLEVVGFLDDERHKWGNTLRGIRIYATPSIDTLIREQKFDELIVASGKIPEERLGNVIRCCERAGLSLRRFQITFVDVNSSQLAGCRSEPARFSPGKELTPGGVTATRGVAGMNNGNWNSRRCSQPPPKVP